MSWALWTTFAMVSAVNIVTPGPANLNTLRRALQLGARRVVPTILGNALGLALGGTLCAAGITAFAMASPLWWQAFRWIGIAYLAWLGVKLLVKREKILSAEADGPAVRAHALFAEAFLLAASNPKALLFYIALFPQVLDPAQPLAPQAALLIASYCALSILSLGTYSALAQLLRRSVMTQARYDRFRQVSGVVLIGFALKLMLGA